MSPLGKRQREPGIARLQAVGGCQDRRPGPPSATEEQLEAIHDAIATWSDVLDRCFDGLIT